MFYTCFFVILNQQREKTEGDFHQNWKIDDQTVLTKLLPCKIVGNTY